MSAVVRSVEIKAPPSAVWKWMSSQDGLRQWLSPNIDIDLRVGGSYRFLDVEGDARISGVVLDIVPEGGLTLSWIEEGSDWVHPARRVLEVTGTPVGSRVTAGIGKTNWPDTLRALRAGG